MHRLGVIHRDVKPSNCFLTPDGRIKVGDFGLSKSLTKAPLDKDVTLAGVFLGTILFASQEQIRGEPVGYDSDVYSVCATLYFLLSGRAPYQHESMTASVAMAVSQPPPSLRAIRKEIPRALERVIFRGMERDRKLRWQTLSELRDTLNDLIPDQQTPARPRMMILAYVADFLLLQIVLVPLGVLHGAFLRSSTGNLSFNLLESSWPAAVVSLIYFTLTQGLTGATLGKWLLGLRVTRIDETGPPGVLAAFVRTLAFQVMLLFIFILPNEIMRLLSSPWNFILLSLSMIIGIGLLCRQFKWSEFGYRGFHDFASGCRVVQPPWKAYRVELDSRFNNPLDQTMTTQVALPATVGGFGIIGKLCNLPDKGELWLAEDRSLGRKMLLRVLAVGATNSDLTSNSVTRPTRLRLVGNGRFVWQKHERHWIGYVAPTGAPLVDVVDPENPLTWAETRLLLEQLAAELEASESDGSGTWRPTIEQIWVEPGGRLQLLDFSLPVHAPVKGSDPSSGNNNPLTLLRQLTSLCLEGKARADGGALAAPLPPHASDVCNKLFDKDQQRSIAALRYDLAECSDLVPVVSGGIRFAHIGVQAAMLSIGLVAMFILSGLLSLEMAVASISQVRVARTIARDLDDRTRRDAMIERMQTIPDQERRESILNALSDEQRAQTVKRLERYANNRQERLDNGEDTLNVTEKAILEMLDLAQPSESAEVFPTQVLERTLSAATESSRKTQNRMAPPDRMMLVYRSEAATMLLFPFLIWPLFAFIFRGGLSMQIAGVTLVRQNGQRSGRFRCVLREWLVWLPLVLLLEICLWVQAYHPTMVIFRTGLWLSGFGLLLLYVVIALRDPARPIQDRIMGTHLVPE